MSEQLPLSEDESAYTMCRCRGDAYLGMGCWTCFHCGERFPTTDEGTKEAQLHFGIDPFTSDPGCLVKYRLSLEDKTLLAQIRDLEEQVADLRVALMEYEG